MALEADAVWFSYPDGFVALTDVTFRVRQGGFVAMLASNGSGKTTLIKVLAGLLKSQRGVTRIHGRELGAYPQSELYQRVGLVFQNPNDQLFCATVQDDVAFGPRNLGLPEAEVQQRVAHALAAVGAEHLAGRAIHHLSYGQQKRVAIAGVLAMKPPILILDEPTAGLDPLGEHEMLRLLGELNRDQGITIVLATHSVDTLPLFADRIYVLNQGQVLKEGTPEEVFLDTEMIQRASLRLPYVTRLLHELQRFDGVPIRGMPLTVREARDQLLDLIPEHLIEEVPLP
ncbi:MAG: energy-coupling factor ABC transporter ATP-binding protein [Verrucomicrobiales bacterium]